MAIPRLAPSDGDASIALPQPLEPSDAVLVRRAFALQERGDLTGADYAIAEMHNGLLLGHLRADRYLGRFHRASIGELTEWLDRYPDEPDVAAIGALLSRRRSNGQVRPPRLAAHAARPTGTKPISPVTTEQPSIPEPPLMPRDPRLERAIAAHLQHGAAGSALRLIDARRGLAAAYASLLRGNVVRDLFLRNDDAKAVRVAQAAVRSVPAAQAAGLAAYVGGLSAWRMGNTAEARRLFSAAAAAGAASSSLQAAAAFWAARAADHERDSAEAARWRQRAAEQRFTLHGILARRMLGLPSGIVPSGALLTQADVDAVAATDAGWRAFALLQAGQRTRAAVELRNLWPAARHDPALTRALLLVAASVGLDDCAAQLEALREADQPPGRDEVLDFVLPSLRPANGFSVDRALIYALTRVESNFDSDAVSPAGARGLMQIRPEAVRAIAVASQGARLYDPAVNLELGQRYLLFLAGQHPIGNSLLALLVSYNAGLTNFLHWREAMRGDDDPLLFIEAIPNDETRRFVEHTLTYTWIYAARLHRPAPSLDEMAAGRPPRFTPAPAERTIAEARLLR